MLGTVLLCFAFVFAVLASWGWPAVRVHLGWLAMSFYFASLLFGSVSHLFR